jgi:deoxyadenosine/deoxycytidine kinase
LPPPNLLIYLKAPIPVLMKRIQQRARSMETGITQDYLSLLESFYTDWIASFDICPVLTIHTGKMGEERPLDFVHNKKHLDIVLERIQDKLAGKEEVIFDNG